MKALFIKGFIEVYCTSSGRETLYALYRPDPEALEAAGAAAFEQLHTRHWGIECFHRAGKQLCALKRFRVRLKEAIHTHLFCARRAFVELEGQVWPQQLGNWDERHRHLYQDVARQFILQATLMGKTP